MSCPEPIVLSRFADGDLATSERRDVDRHLRECEDCREAVDGDEAVARALGGKAVCPDPECLALFIDDALGPPRVDVVAAHVLVCDACRSVVAWTREAVLATDRVGSKSGRRRPRLRPRSVMPGWLPAVVGAAAAVLLVVLIARPDRRATPGSGPDHARVEPRPTATQSPPPVTTERRPTITPTPPDPATEAPTPPDPATEPDAPDEVDPASPTEPTPSTTEPAPTPTATEATTTTPPSPPPAAAPVLVAALPGGSLRYREPSGAEGELTGALALAPGTRLLGGRQGGGLRVGDATCFVDGQSELRLREPAPERQAVARVELLDGQVTVDAAGPTIEVACGPAIVRPTDRGAYLVVSADGPDRALLCVVTGEAEVGDLAAAAPSRLGPGESARVEGGRVKPVRGDARLARAEELATTAALAQGVDFPGGVRVRRVLATAGADLAAGDVARRAWATYAVLAVHRAGPRLARLADPHADAARRALTELLALPADAISSGAAAVPLLLAAVADERHGLDQTAVARLAEAIASRPGAELVADGDALLALRAAERLTPFKAPRALWPAVAALPLDGPVAGARAVLARRPLDAAARKQVLADLDALLARDPLAQPIEPRALLDAQRSLVLLGAATDERRARVLGHAGAPDRADALLALAAAHDTAAAVGLAGTRSNDDPASVVVAPQPDGRFRVTFVFSSARRPKQVLLLGGWDQWAEPGLAMRERADGTFTATIVLPAGRHEYKLRLGVGGVWEHDTQNPLMAGDGMGGVNSVLVLE